MVIFDIAAEKEELMDILYSLKAEKQLKKIHMSDKKSAVRIVKTIESYAKNPDGNFDVNILKGKLSSFKRLRVGNYRVIFDENGHVLHIYQIKHRQESYK